MRWGRTPRASARRLAETPRPRLLDVEFEQIAHVEAREAVDEDAALLALLDLLDVVLEMLEHRDLALVDRRAAAHDADVRAARDLAVAHRRAADDAALHGESLLDLALADDHVDHLGSEEALERGLDVLDELVDDLVAADLDAVAPRD